MGGTLERMASSHKYHDAGQSTEDLWGAVIATWGSKEYSRDNIEVLKEVVTFGGVPRDFRSRIWQLSSGSLTLKDNSVGVYARLMEAGSDQGGVIQRDVERTYFQVDDFREGPGAESLKNVLIAYTALDPTVGYCQGMSFIAAHCLMWVTDEESAFWLFVSVIGQHRGFYLPNLPGHCASINIFENLLKTRLPTLAAHLKRWGVTPDVYMSGWFLSLFCQQHFPIETSVRVWDYYFGAGLVALFQVGLAILSLSREELCGLSSGDDLQHYLKKLPPYVLDPDALLRAAVAVEIPGDVQAEIKAVESRRGYIVKAARVKGQGVSTLLS